MSVLTPHYFLLFLCHLIFTVGATSAARYAPVNNIAINCGSSGNSTSQDGRWWTGDIGSKYASHHHLHHQQPSSKSSTSKAPPEASGFVDPVPYMTARISHSQFAYKFQVSPGQKFIRLHFHPALYPGFERSAAFFTVKAGHYTLLNNFSASLAADVMGLTSFAKEFCMNVEENQTLVISFLPSPNNAAYAFINGIEIVSMPTGLYYTNDGDLALAANIVGLKYGFYIDNHTALEMVHRLNIGGSSVLSVEDSGMFREWSSDSNYLSKSSVVPVTTTIAIKYTSIPTYTAPQKVYQTAWSMGIKKLANEVPNFTWKLPVDLGFRYLIRLHFCELEYGIKDSGQRVFSIFMNNKMAEASADLIKWSGGNGVAVYRDYVVMMEGDRRKGKCDLLITLKQNYYESTTNHTTDPILNGLEVFKLSNPDNNLAGSNHVYVAHAPIYRALKPKILGLAFDSGNGFVNGVIIVLIILNIIVYQLRLWRESYNQMNISSSFSKEFCRYFSFAEIQSASDNFNDVFFIGCGGFGEVYKGKIDNGATTVAIKRLNSKSKQGALEFWTEIETLSKLRHAQLVSLIGYCNESQEMILVYEYMANGTLADHLYKFNSPGNDYSLTWEQRLNICIDAARGLDFLHTGTQHSVIHRDVKTTNILLDENLAAKISDFGLSKMGTTSQSCTHVSTDVKGTFGYLDPEYFLTHRLTSKSDVYAFGVVLLEVLCGRSAVDLKLPEEQHNLALWAQHCIKEGTLDQIIDPHLRGQISLLCLKEFVEVIIKCLHYRPSERPTMAEVVSRLQLLLVSEKILGSCTSEQPTMVEAISRVELLLASKKSLGSCTSEQPTMAEVVSSLELLLASEKSLGSCTKDEEEEKEIIDGGRADNEEIHGVMQLGGSGSQYIGTPSIDTTASKRGSKLTISKVVFSIARRIKAMDLLWRKTKESSSTNGNSQSTNEHGIHSLESEKGSNLNLSDRLNVNVSPMLVEEHMKQAEVSRLRVLHTIKGRVESKVKLKGLDIDIQTMQLNYSV